EAQDKVSDTLALSLYTPIEVDVPLYYEYFKMEQESAIETALKNRIEIEQVGDSFQESLRVAGIAKDNLWPELNLVLTYNNTGIGRYLVDSYRYKRDNTWNVGFSSSMD